MAARGDAAGYKVAYDAGLQAVAEQASTLRETRDRAGSLMPAAAVAGGLAAGLAFSADRVSGIDQIGVVGAVLAVAGFVGVVVATMMIGVRPRVASSTTLASSLGRISKESHPST